MAQAPMIDESDYALRHTKTILQRFFPSPRNFRVRLWDQTELLADTDPKFTLVLNHPEALRRMLTPPMGLSLGEAYIHCDFDIEGDFYSALGQAVSPAGLGLTPTEITSLQHDFQLHEDPGNEFYAVWLDNRMQLSCGYFPTGIENLETAQVLKIDHICRKLRLKPGERLLDIGCGWGGLAIAAAQRYQVKVIGVTPSEQQAAYGAEQVSRMGLDDQVKILQGDIRELNDERFDKIVSLDLLGYVGRYHLPEYYSQAYRLLKTGGLFLNQGISRRGQPSDVFPLKRYAFPDGELVTLSEANLVAESAGFEVLSVENLREHTALTMRHWVSRLEEHQGEAVHLVGETVYRTWQLYLSFYTLAFEAGRTNVNQTLLEKPLNGKANMPAYR